MSELQVYLSTFWTNYNIMNALHNTTTPHLQNGDHDRRLSLFVDSIRISSSGYEELS